MECCYNNKIEDIRDLIINSKNKILEYTDEYYKNLTYGYSCNKDLKQLLNKLNTYLEIIEKTKHQVVFQNIQKNCNIDNNSKIIIENPVCLHCDAYQLLYEKIQNLIGKYCSHKCSDLEIDSSEEEKWIENNPECLSYNDWDKWARIKIRRFRIKASTTEILEKLLLELSVKSIKEDILIVSKVVNDAKKLNINLKRKNQDQLKLELNLLLERFPKAEIDLKLYKKLIDHNISFSIIAEILSNNLELQVTSKNNSEKVYIKSSVYTYPIEEIFTELPLEELSEELRLKYINLLSSYKNG